MKTCSCGYHNPDDNRFCTVCGKPLDEVQQPTVQQGATPSQPSTYDGFAQQNDLGNAGVNPNGNNYAPNGYNNNYNPNGNNYNPNGYNNNYNPNGYYNQNGYNQNNYNYQNNYGGPQNNRFNPGGFDYNGNPFAQEPPVAPAIKQFRDGIRRLFASPLTLITGILLTITGGVSLFSGGGLQMALLLIIGIGLIVTNSKAKNNAVKFDSISKCLKVYNVINIVLYSLSIAGLLIIIGIFSSIPVSALSGSEGEVLKTLIGLVTLLCLINAIPVIFGIVSNSFGIKASSSISISVTAGVKTSKGLLPYAITCFISAVASLVSALVTISVWNVFVDAMMEFMETMEGALVAETLNLSTSSLLFVSVLYSVALILFGVWLIKVRSFNNNFVARKEDADSVAE